MVARSYTPDGNVAAISVPNPVTGAQATRLPFDG
jgi:hypothetical protein